jgi:hypothetical protein
MVISQMTIPAPVVYLFTANAALTAEAPLYPLAGLHQR